MFLSATIGLLSGFAFLTLVVLEQLGFLVLTLQLMGPLWFICTVSFLTLVHTAVRTPAN